jgi:anti-anti-sigma factor
VGFTIERRDTEVNARLQGELSAGNRLEFRTACLAELDQGGRNFRIDLSQMAYADSSGLALLLSLHKKIRQRGGEMRLASPNPDVRQLLALTKLDTLFVIDEAADVLPTPALPPSTRRLSREVGSEQGPAA